MTIKQQCQDAIYNYVDAETQRNAALTGEHKEYVLMVLGLLRAAYKDQVDRGLTEFTVPEEVGLLLTDECPW